MLVGIIQSNYIPWRGYFDFIDDVDLFIIHDDLLFTRDWRNRNYIKVGDSRQWLTVPVTFSYADKTLICDTKISYEKDWISTHLNRLQATYRAAPYFNLYFTPLKELFLTKPQTISELNLKLITWIAECLGITTQIRMSSEFSPEGTKTERLIGILKRAQATHYLSGPAADAYLDKEMFKAAEIKLSYKQYSYPSYPQFNEPFIGEVSVLDLLFHTGPNARQYLKSTLPNLPIVN